MFYYIFSHLFILYKEENITIAPKEFWPIITSYMIYLLALKNLPQINTINLF